MALEQVDQKDKDVAFLSGGCGAIQAGGMCGGLGPGAGHGACAPARPSVSPSAGPCPPPARKARGAGRRPSCDRLLVRGVQNGSVSVCWESVEMQSRSALDLRSSIEVAEVAL